jgi:hypothetical protein
LTGAEKVAARKAAGLMFGTQFLLGGVVGMPFVAAGMGVVDELFPEAQVKRKLRTAFFGLASDDADMGHLIADVAMGGVFGALPNGPDVGSRFQLGSMLGVSPYSGFTWKNLAGAGASTLESLFVKAPGELVRGQVGKAFETAAPSGVKQLVRVINDDWQVRDYSERLVMEPSEAEKVMMAIGFKPKRFNQYMERQALIEQSELARSRETTRFHSDMADRLLAGDGNGVQSALYARQLEDNRYDVRAGLAKVVKMVQDRVTPVDPRREGTLGNAEDVEQILRLYPQAGGPTEMQRLESGRQLEQAVGIPMPPTGRDEYRRALLIDQVMQMNPMVSRAQAASMVQRMLSPRTHAQRFSAGQ